MVKKRVFVGGMKKLLTIAVSLLASVQFSSADLIASLVGRWKSNNTGPNAELNVEFTRLGRKGFVYQSTLSTPSQPDSTGVVNYRGNGTVRGTVNHGGVIATIAGTWRIRGNTFIETSVITSRVATTNLRTRSTLVNPRKINVNSVVNGTSSVGTLSKLR